MSAQPAHAAWWHERSEALGLTMVLDMVCIRRERTARHDVEVLEHARFGRALAVDGILQSVEQDAALREMLIHVPMLGHTRRPRRVLLVGEDVAALAEVLRHDVETVIVSTNDPALLEVGADALGLGAPLRDSRMAVREPGPSGPLGGTDGRPFDLVVVASADLRRPAPGGSRHAFVMGEAIAGAIAGDGIVVDSDRALILRHRPRWYRDAPEAGPSLLAAVRQEGVLPSVERYFTTSSLAAGGFLGFFIYSRGGVSCATPRVPFEGSHYNAELHRSAFALPTFWSELP